MVLSKKINPTIQSVILFLLAIYPLTSFLSASFPAMIEPLLVMGLSIIAILILLFNAHFFAAHAILFLLFYADSLFGLLRWLLSFNFDTFNFDTSFSWQLLVFFVIALYLLVMSLSYMFNGGFSLNKNNFRLEELFIFFALLMFLENGVHTFIFIAIVEFIAINYKKMASLCLMLAKTIPTPFAFFALIKDTPLKEISVYNWFILGLAVYVIFLIVKKGVIILKKAN